MNIVSLMSTGAAPGLAFDLAMSAKARGLSFKLIITPDNELINLIKANLKKSEYAEVSLRKDLFSIGLQVLFRGYSIKKKIHSQLLFDNPVVFTMPGIFEFLCLKYIRKRAKVFTFIHDPHRHKGDMMPRNFMIKFFFTKSDNVIFFSKFTQNYLINRYGKRSPIDCVAQHPIPSVISRLPSYVPSDHEYILMIGRNKAYQNFEYVVDIWKKEEVNFQNLQLIIAGRNTETFKDEVARIHVRSKWLNEIEFADLVRGAKYLLLPYLEASQSGPAALAMSMNKSIIYSKIDGLTEQLSRYPKAESFVDKSELIRLLIKANLEKISPQDGSLIWQESWGEILNFIVSESDVRG